MEPETPRDRNSLRDFAKLAAPAGAAPGRRDARRPNADSSGVVDLEALMKEHPSWLDDALSRAKGTAHASMPSSSSLSALAAPVLLAPPSLAPTSLDEAPRGVPKNNMALIAAAVGAVALIVAATGFALKMQSHGAPAHVAAAAVAAPATPAPRAEDAIAIPPPPAVAEVTTAPAPAAAPSPNEAPAEASASTPTEDAPASRHGRGHGVHHAALAHHAAAAAQEPVAAAVPPPPAPSKPGKGMSALDAALRGAVPVAAAAPASAPAPAPAPAPASAPSGDRPDRPSGSAVTSALTSALPAARACLAAGAEPSHARITFGSNGNVQGVEVTGPAGSNPKVTSCLRAAFGRAHVPAFAQSSYAAGVTVRPR